MNRFPRWLLALGATALLGAILGVFLLRTRREESPAPKKRLLILGVDGMDPQLLRQYMNEGKMPNFAALAPRGSFLNLQTSTPPQSPEAWANLITCMNPGGHGIFDFIHRDPATLAPYFSPSKGTPPNQKLGRVSVEIPVSDGQGVS